MRKDLIISSKYQACADCGSIKTVDQYEYRNRMHIYCRDCHRRRAVERKEMAAKKSQIEACRQLSRALVDARNTKESANVPAIISAFMGRIGGPEGLGEMLAEDFRRVRGDDLSPEEKMFHKPQQGVIQKYYTMLLRANEKRDEQVSTADITSFSDEELKAVLVSVAVELLQSDDDFRKLIVNSLLEEDPRFFDKELREVKATITLEHNHADQ